MWVIISIILSGFNLEIGENIIMEEIKLEIPSSLNNSNPIKLSLKNGDQLFIVGANGSGKSALMQRFVLNLPKDRAKRITAHRQTWFSSGSIDLTPANRQEYDKQNRSYDRNYESRWKVYNPGWNLSVALFDLVAKENTRARAITRQVDNDNCEKAVEISAESSSPFDGINELLSLATFTVTIENSNDRDLLARHLKGQSFSIAEMSDGERNAMVIAAQVITAEAGTVFLIDEPERHLHPSITQPFLSALFDLRSEDCTFVISTHEIGLPLANSDAQVIMLRSCQWSGNQCVAWDAEILEPNSQIPEELKRAILGSRKRILFVEGDADNSLDFPLYTALFPDISVIPKGSCEEVQKAVLGLQGTSDEHDVEAFGLIDRDNRTDNDVEKLVESRVFALEVYSAEALYYCSDAIAAIADRQAESLGADKDELIKSANEQAIDVLKKQAKRMTARRCERQVKETMSKSLNWEMIMDNPTQDIQVSTDNPFTDELGNFNKLIEQGNLDKLIARYPVRESCAFEMIAQSLRCRNKEDYERMVTTQIRHDNELAEKLKKRIGPLSSRLKQVENSQTVETVEKDSE